MSLRVARETIVGHQYDDGNNAGTQFVKVKQTITTIKSFEHTHKKGGNHCVALSRGRLYSHSLPCYTNALSTYRVSLVVSPFVLWPDACLLWTEYDQVQTASHSDRLGKSHERDWFDPRARSRFACEPNHLERLMERRRGCQCSLELDRLERDHSF